MKTIKQLLLVSTLILFSQISFAQFTYGVKAGIGGATESELGDICNNSDIRLVYNAGFTVKNQLNNWFAVKGDVLFAQRGSACEIIENGSTTDFTRKLDYLLIPVKAEFSTPLEKGKFFFATGPYTSFLLSAKQEINDVSSDIKGDTQNADFGLTFEVGVVKPLSKTDLVFSLNYNMGFSETSEIENDLQNKALTLNIGVLF